MRYDVNVGPETAGPMVGGKFPKPATHVERISQHTDACGFIHLSEAKALLLPAATDTMSSPPVPSDATQRRRCNSGTAMRILSRTARGVVRRPPEALAIKITAGDVTIAHTLGVMIVSADPRGGQPIPVRLSAADGGASVT